MQILPSTSLSSLAGAQRAQNQAAKGDAESQMATDVARSHSNPAGHADGPETLAAGSQTEDRDADGRQAYELPRAGKSKKEEKEIAIDRPPPSLDGRGSVLDLQG